ncbi:hypothetical protein ACFL2Q_15800 [Thermodesulfobacteriota bacterium]
MRNEAADAREIVDMERELFRKLMKLGQETLQEFVDDCNKG